MNQNSVKDYKVKVNLHAHRQNNFTPQIKEICENIPGKFQTCIASCPRKSISTQHQSTTFRDIGLYTVKYECFAEENIDGSPIKSFRQVKLFHIPACLLCL